MQLCEAKYRPWDERRKKGCGCARRHVPEKRKASLADNRAKNAALSVQTAFFAQNSLAMLHRVCAKTCRTKRPPKAAMSQRPRPKTLVRRQIGEKAALSRQSGCTCPAGKLLFRILPVPARQKTGLWNCAVHVSSLFSISVLQPCFQSFIIKEDS